MQLGLFVYNFLYFFYKTYLDCKAIGLLMKEGLRDSLTGTKQ